jgi:hypothetical protein
MDPPVTAKSFFHFLMVENERRFRDLELIAASAGASVEMDASLSHKVAILAKIIARSTQKR